MGYTHYWTRKMDVPVTGEQWDKISTAMAQIAMIMPKWNIKLCSEYDEPDSDVEITSEHIRFNGAGDEGHETFYLKRNPHLDFDFCKTAWKPYNVAVCAILLAVDYYATGAWEISTDGTREDWHEANALFEMVTGAVTTGNINYAE